MKTILAGLLIIHTLGHFLGVYISNQEKQYYSWNSQSWLLDKVLSTSTTNWTAILIFMSVIVSAMLCLLSLYGYVKPTSNWIYLGLLSSVFSIVGLILFPNALNKFYHKIGAIFTNTILIVIYLFFNDGIQVIL